MKVNVTVPPLGESVAEGTVLEWHKKEGDLVKKDEILLILSTDKVNAEIPAPTTGRLTQILVAEGETIAVGTTVASIETDISLESPAPAPPKADKTKVETITLEEKPATESPEQIIPPPKKEKRGKVYSPLAEIIAEKEGIPLEELEELQGSGPGGRVMKQDILTKIKERRARVEDRELRSEDQTVLIEHGLPSSIFYPQSLLALHAISIAEIDMTELVQYLERVKETFEKQEGVELTYLPFILTALAKVLRQFPLLNASVEGDKATLKKSIHIGFTVPLEKGMVTPIIKEADSLNLMGMARIIDDLTYRARIRKLEPEELQGGTFTVSNSGVFGAIVDIPIIHPAQIAILGIGSIKKRLVVIDDMIAIRSMMYASLSYDHRVIEGSMAARFLQAFAHTLETVDLDLLKV